MSPTSAGRRLIPLRLPLRSDLAELARLAVPVVTVQLGLMTMGVVDTFMVGHRSAVDLAAVALGHLLVMAAIALPMGILLALDPLVAQAVGASDRPGVRRSLQRGLLLALLLSLPPAAMLLPAQPLLALLGQPEAVVPVAGAYARVSIAGLVPFLLFVALRQTLQALHRLRPIVLVIIAANAANVVLDWVLIFGNLGAPALGAVGSSWATVVCRWLMTLGLAAIAWRDLRPLLLPLDPAAARLLPLVRMIVLGAPIGLQMLLEFTAFGVVGVLAGRLGTEAVGAHQVAINLAALTFMVPLGISAAAAVLVGQAVGRGDVPACRRAAGAALLTGVGFMTAAAALFLGAPGLLAGAFTDVPGVYVLAVRLIPVAGFFQVFDGIQVVAAGALRGLGDTRAPLVYNLLAFWLVGIPVSLLLGFTAGAGAVGLWWGLVAGLGLVAALLLLRLRARLAQPLSRLDLDASAG